jgi:hypothetical protein
MMMKTMSEIDTKEVAVVQQQSSKALTAAQELTIAKAEDLSAASELLIKMKKVGKMIKDRKEEITKPLQTALNSARDLFKPIESNLVEAERVVKGKMVDYQNKIEKDANDERLRLAKRVEKGTMKPITAVRKMEEIQEAPKSVQTTSGAMAFRDVKKVRFADVTALKGPEIIELVLNGYLVWNETVARKDALAGKQIPGVEVYTEKVVASSSKLDSDSPLLGQK